MKTILLIATIALCSCGAYPVAKTTPPPALNQNFTVNKSYDKTWDAVLRFIFLNNYKIRSQFKGDATASIRIELKDASITYIDNKTKDQKDSTAIAVSQMRYRPGSQTKVYPAAGTFDCVISISKTSDGLVYVSVVMDKTCVLTQYWENYYLEKRRRWPGVEIESSGRMESELKTTIDQFN